MISAFGVEHEFSKSLVGGVFKPASKLSRAERSAVGGYKKAKGVSEGDRTYRDVVSPGLRQMVNQNKQFKDVKVSPMAALEEGDRGFTVRHGSAKGGTSHIVGHAKTEAGRNRILTHEQQHANPKRSEYRMHEQIAKDPKKLLREEARADMHSEMGYYRKLKSGKPASVYGASARTGNTKHIQRAYGHMSDKEATEGMHAYRQVQDKIAGNKKPYRRPLKPHEKDLLIYGGGGVAGGVVMHQYTKPEKKELKKSFVDPFKIGAAAKPARLLTGAERATVKNRIVSNRQEAKDWGISHGNSQPLPNRGHSAQFKGGRKLPGGVGATKNVKVNTSHEVIEHPTTPGKFKNGNAQYNGRGGGTITMFPKSPTFDAQKHMAHEMAHVGPKRNPVRARERLNNPLRSGREEGRADFIAHGRATPGKYPGTPEFQQGYNEVQGRMTTAQGRRKR